MNQKTEAALSYLSDGFCPIPVWPRNDPRFEDIKQEDGTVKRVFTHRKKPTIPTWREFEIRKPTEDEVVDWWESNPNWDMALVGGHGGLACIDLDTKEWVDKAKTDLMTLTRMADTEKGMHIWAKEIEPSRSGPLGDSKIDIKAVGGYFIVPPSYASSWVNLDVEIKTIDNAREWAINYFGLKEKMANKDSNKLYSSLLEDGNVPTGMRDDGLVSILGKLWSLGMPKDQLLNTARALASTIVSQDGEPFTERDAEAKAYSVMRYQQSVTKAAISENFPPLIPNTRYAREKIVKPRWLVQDIIPQAATTVIGAQEGVFKTWLMLELMYNRGESRDYLGHFPVSMGRTLFIDGENGQDVMQERIQVLRKNSKEYDEIFYIQHLMVGILTDEHVAKIIPLCKEKGINCIVFDPYQQFIGGSDVDPAFVAPLCSKMTRFHAEGIATIILHHHKKPNQYEERTDVNTFDLRGSTILAAHASSIIQLKPVDGGIKVFHTKSRRGKKIDPFVVSVGEGPTFTYSGISTSDFIMKMQQTTQDVMKFLESKNGVGKRGDIVWKLAGDDPAKIKEVDSALSALSRAGDLVKTQRGVYQIPGFMQTMFEEKEEQLSDEERDSILSEMEVK